MQIPSLRSGHGLPTHHIALCDGRTSARFSNHGAGFDRLVHYAADSWGNLARVLQYDGHAATWTVDGELHQFEWVEAFSFSYINRETSRHGVVSSCCLVEQGSISWRLEGLRERAVLSLPLSFFWEVENVERGAVLERTAWHLADKLEAGAWHARREEEWLQRDRSTYAEIAGKVIPALQGRSEFHLCARAREELVVERVADRVLLNVPAHDGIAVLSLGLGSSYAEAEACALAASVDFDGILRRQEKRYGLVAGETPVLEYGRHYALNRFFSVVPLYLESLRVADEPAAFRANNDYHWVWSWDMTRPAFGLLNSNRGEWVRDLLEFRGRHRNADGRSINEYDCSLRRDLRFSEDCDWLEICLAHDYLAWTGDEAGLPKATGWLRGELERAFERADPGTGMVTLPAASTDFPEEFGRTFQGWLAYPTGWQYNALCGAEKLFLKWGDEEFASLLRDWAAKVRRNFARVFWNETTGFWNEGVHPTDPDLLCDIPLSTALAMMDGPYGQDLLGERLPLSARYAREQFLREDGVHITARGETRGWKEWTRQPNNWFAANDTMLARLFRASGDARSLDKLFALYELNFAAHPCGFEGKPFGRPLETSGSWQAFGAAAWQRNLVEAGAGLWAHLGGLTLVPCGLREPLQLNGLKFRDSTIDFSARGQGAWPRQLLLDGEPVVGTLQLPVLAAGQHRLQVEYSAATPATPLLLAAIDAEIADVRLEGTRLSATLKGHGYTPLHFYSPTIPMLAVDGKTVPCEWDEISGRGSARLLLADDAKIILS